MAIRNTVLTDLESNCDTLKGNKPGQYRVDDASIDYGGVSHQIGIYLQKIYVFEDIDNFGITGWIEMLDSDNLISGFDKHRIVGQELLRFKFRTLGSHLPVDFMNHPVHIHKIENLRQYKTKSGAGSGAVQQYRLHFCSPELLNNDRIRVSKAYVGKRYDEMVQDILENHLMVKKDVWLEKTSGMYNLIIPNMHPYDAINLIAKKAKNSKGHRDFNFYETSNGFRFKTMYNQSTSSAHSDAGDVQITYTWSDQLHDNNYMTQMQTAIGHKFVRTGDTYTAIKDGMFSSKSIYHDSYHKRYEVDALRYGNDRHANSIPHIIRGAVYVPTGKEYPAQVPEFKSIGYDEFPDSRIFYSSSSTRNAWNSAKVSPKGIIRTKDGKDDPLAPNKKAMAQAHDRYLQIQLTVHGLSGLQVGDGIQLKVPKQGTKKKAGPDDDRWTSTGAYYIIKLVHRIILESGNPSYKTDVIISPLNAGRTSLPGNADHTGVSDKRQGKIQDFGAKLERMEEAD
jgi:hypothetical protein